MSIEGRNFETPFIKAILKDRSLPIADVAVEMWIKDLRGGLRLAVMPILRVLLSGVLILVWFVKRTLPIQFSSHEKLQKLICWFSKNFIMIIIYSILFKTIYLRFFT